MPEQRFSLEDHDELEPVEPNINASDLPVSVFEPGLDFIADEGADTDFLANFGVPQTTSVKEAVEEESTKKTPGKVPFSTPTATPVKPSKPLPERIAHLVAAGPPMPVIYTPSPVDKVEEEEEVEPEVEEETVIEDEVVVAAPVRKTPEEPRPPLIQNVGLPRYIVLSTTIMTVAALAPLFLP